MTPPINNPEEKKNIHDLVMGILQDILKTGINITRDRLHCSIDTIKELYKKKTNTLEQ